MLIDERRAASSSDQRSEASVNSLFSYSQHEQLYSQWAACKSASECKPNLSCKLSLGMQHKDLELFSVMSRAVNAENVNEP